MKNLPSVSELRRLFLYDEEAGELVWKERPRADFTSDGSCRAWNTKFPGRVAGCVGPTGYRVIKFGGTIYKAHRLIWKMKTGADPFLIDHENGIITDNRFANLRSVDHVENGRNRKLDSRNSAGVSGVMYDRGTRNWRAYISIHGRQKRLGNFSHKEDAVAARQKAEREIGYNANHGRVA